MRYPQYIEADFAFPPFYHVTMQPPQKRIQDLEAALLGTLDRALPQTGILPGHQVAVGVGSRGIAELPRIVRAVCERIQAMGAHPFIIPAMGSHGGATDAGQRRILNSLGVTEESCGAPIRSSLAAVPVGTVLGEVPVYFAKDALAADHSVCINRIKAHTKFKAAIESGLLKMICVGMGKHQGALAYHQYALKYGFARLLEKMGAKALAQSNLRLGLAVVENAADEPLHVEAVPASAIARREPALLRMAKACFPRLPIDAIDALIIGKIGKEISGSGMDPNVTGRTYDLKESDFSSVLKATRVALLRLSPHSRGNAIGLGNADIITEQLFADMDYEATVINALTSLSLRKAFIPVRLPSDEKAIQAAFCTLGPVLPEKVRAVLIRDTLHVGEFWVSQALKPEVEAVSGARIAEKVALEFDGKGALIDPPLY